jgi:hypothetical protein
MAYDGTNELLYVYAHDDGRVPALTVINAKSGGLVATYNVGGGGSVKQLLRAPPVPAL